MNLYQQATGVKGSGKPVGYIGSFNCSSDAFELSRGTQKLPLSVFMLLYHADQLKVMKENCKISALLKKDGQPILISQANSPYTVIEKSSSSSKSNFASWIENLLENQKVRRLSAISK